MSLHPALGFLSKTLPPVNHLKFIAKLKDIKDIQKYVSNITIFLFRSKAS